MAFTSMEDDHYYSNQFIPINSNRNSISNNNNSNTAEYELARKLWESQLPNTNTNNKQSLSTELMISNSNSNNTESDSFISSITSIIRNNSDSTNNTDSSTNNNRLLYLEQHIAVLTMRIDELQQSIINNTAAVNNNKLLSNELYNLLQQISTMILLQQLELTINEQQQQQQQSLTNPINTVDNINTIEFSPRTVIINYIESTPDNQWILAIIDWLELIYSNNNPSNNPNTNIDNTIQAQFNRTIRKYQLNSNINHQELQFTIDSSINNNNTVDNNDLLDENELFHSLWLLLRSGQQNNAIQLSNSAGQYYRGISLSGNILYHDSIGLLSNTNNADTDTDTTIVGNKNRFTYKSICKSIINNSEIQLNPYERSIYSLLSNHYTGCLSLCNTFEDYLWLYCKQFINKQIDLKLVNTILQHYSTGKKLSTINNNELLAIKQYLFDSQSQSSQSNLLYSINTIEDILKYIINQSNTDINNNNNNNTIQLAAQYNLYYLIQQYIILKQNNQAELLLVQFIQYLYPITIIQNIPIINSNSNIDSNTAELISIIKYSSGFIDLLTLLQFSLSFYLFNHNNQSIDSIGTILILEYLQYLINHNLLLSESSINNSNNNSINTIESITNIIFYYSNLLPTEYYIAFYIQYLQLSIFNYKQKKYYLNQLLIQQQKTAAAAADADNKQSNIVQTIIIELVKSIIYTDNNRNNNIVSESPLSIVIDESILLNYYKQFNNNTTAAVSQSNLTRIQSLQLFSFNNNNNNPIQLLECLKLINYLYREYISSNNNYLAAKYLFEYCIELRIDSAIILNNIDNSNTDTDNNNNIILKEYENWKLYINILNWIQVYKNSSNNSNSNNNNNDSDRLLLAINQLFTNDWMYFNTSNDINSDITDFQLLSLLRKQIIPKLIYLYLYIISTSNDNNINNELILFPSILTNLDYHLYTELSQIQLQSILKFITKLYIQQKIQQQGNTNTTNNTNNIDSTSNQNNTNIRSTPKPNPSSRKPITSTRK